jgi:hypothetical protein
MDLNQTSPHNSSIEYPKQTCLDNKAYNYLIKQTITNIIAQNF